VRDEIDTVHWLFGRGLSLSCGLDWDDLRHCPQLSRDEKIQCIKEELKAAMDAPEVNRAPIRDLLQFLSERTQGLEVPRANNCRPRWRHRFLTTNWDFLLQQEINKFAPDSVPDWLRPTTLVYHLNGTVEDCENRSAIVLREDTERTPSPELNEAFGHIAWGSIFVIVGMSFECKPDKGLFNLLNEVQDMLPVGESNWIIVNPCSADLDNARDLVKRKLPQANVTAVPHTLTCWREAQFPQLKEKGVFS
jgi:hypothetical protein